LLAEVRRQIPRVTVQAPIVVAGHSGAWRTIGGWADDAGTDGGVAENVDAFVLLDALYGMDDRFQHWLERHPGTQPRLTLVSRDTAERASAFVAAVPVAKRRPRLPGSYAELTPAERSAPVLEIASDYGHMEIVTSGRVLPVMLHRSPLKTLGKPSAKPSAPKHP
jgi:hypothetical protein